MSERSVRRHLHRAQTIEPDVRARIKHYPGIAHNARELDALAGLPADKQRQAVAALDSGEAKTIREAKQKWEVPPPPDSPWRAQILKLWNAGTSEDQRWFMKKIIRITEERHKAMRFAQQAAKIEDEMTRHHFDGDEIRSFSTGKRRGMLQMTRRNNKKTSRTKSRSLELARAAAKGKEGG